MSGTKESWLPRFSDFFDPEPATETAADLMPRLLARKNDSGKADGKPAALPAHASPFERLCHDPRSLRVHELESLIPKQLYGILSRLRGLFRCGGIFFGVTASPRDDGYLLILETRCKVYERYTETYRLPDIHVARAVAECLDRWSTGRCATRTRAYKRRSRSP